MVKHFIISIAAVLAVSAAAISCDDNNTVWSDPTNETLKVISHDTSFPPTASRGSVVVDANGPVSVVSDDGGWLTTAVDGNTVTIEATQNSSLEGRTATLTISSGDRQTNISVIQSGAYFDMGTLKIIKSNDSAHTFKYKVNSNLPVEFSTSDDFISTSFDDKTSELSVSVTRNRTGHLRQGYVNYKFGDNEGSIPVKQCDFYKDLEGDYMFVYTDDKDHKQYYYEAYLTEEDEKYRIDIEGLGISIPVKYDENDFSLSICGGSFCGYETRNNYKYVIATGMWAPSEGYVTFLDFVSMTGEFIYGKLADGRTATIAEFIDDGSWGAFVSTGIVLELFTKMPATTDTRTKEVFKNLLYPYIIRVHEGQSNVSAPAGAETKADACPTEAKLWSPAQDLK